MFSIVRVPKFIKLIDVEHNLMTNNLIISQQISQNTFCTSKKTKKEKLGNLSAADFMFSDLVPAPRHLTLERQLNKSVLIGWNPPDQYGHHQIESYHVYVDGNIKVTVKANERTRALVEGVDSNRVSYPADPGPITRR